jgi:hypothetical protein
VSDDEIIDAYELFEQNKKSFCRFTGLYFWPAGDKKKLNIEECDEFIAKLNNTQFNDFEELFALRDSIHLIDINKEIWQNSSCTCLYYLKNNICHHVIVICEKLSIVLIKFFQIKTYFVYFRLF